MMAKESIEDGEFWLPSDFLDSDDLLTTESEEEEYLASLMSKSRIGDTPQVLATSPQSTLGSWSFSSSPESPSTPLAFAKPRGDKALEVLYQAAGQVVRLGLNGGGGRGLLAHPHPIKASHVHDKEALIQQQLRAAHFYQLKKQQLLKQQYAATAAAVAWGRQSRARDQYAARQQNASSSAWPPLPHQHQQQHQHLRQHGSGMRAVFLGAGARKESAGTGVFLPRKVGAPNEPKKKPACSTVLLPARVVQALNLNLPASGFVLNHDVVMANVAKRNHHYAQRAAAPAAAAAAASHEIRLPPEWTY